MSKERGAGHLLETCVIEMIKTTMTDPSKLKKCLEFTKDKSRTSQWRIEKRLKSIDQKIKDFAEQKKQIIDTYASGQIDRATYAERCQNHDKEVNAIKAERIGLINRIPILHKKDIVDVSVGRYCESVKTRFEISNDQESKRDFMKDYVEEVIYNNTNVALRGSVPIKLKVYEDPDQPSEVGKIGFIIEGKIVRGHKWMNRKR